MHLFTKMGRLPIPYRSRSPFGRKRSAKGDFSGNKNAASADRNLGGFIFGMDASVGETWRLVLPRARPFPMYVERRR